MISLTPFTSFVEKGQKPGTQTVAPEGYMSEPFAQGHFLGFQPPHTKLSCMLFIDGGTAELIALPHLTMSMIRVCGIVQQAKKTVIRKEYVAVAGEQCSIMDMEGNEIPACQELLKQMKGEENGMTMSIMRRCMELQLAAELGQRYRPELIVLDGTLQAEHAAEKGLLEQLAQLPCIIGVSKTSALVTETGMPVSIALQRMTALPSWYYVPIAENHATVIGMARFHPKARHCFRIDLFQGQKGQWDNALSALKSMSNDAVFPGYPYGLILVDALARISEQEKEMLLAQLQVQPQWKGLLPMLAAMDAHEILDRLQF